MNVGNEMEVMGVEDDILEFLSHCFGYPLLLYFVANFKRKEGKG